MFIPNSLTLASALWLAIVCAVAVSLGISTWAGGLALVLASVAPLLIARHFWAAPEQSLSQRIQRELR